MSHSPRTQRPQQRQFLVLGVLAALIAFGLLAALAAQRAAPSATRSNAATKQQKLSAAALTAATGLGGGSRRSLKQFTSLLALGAIGNNLAAGKYDDAIAAALNKSGAAVPPPVTAAAAPAPAAEDEPQYKIVGGAPASPGRWPWVCSVRSSKSDAHFCGCSLVASRLVVTAAHCLDQTRADLALPNIDIGRFLRTAPATGGNGGGSLVPNQFQARRCVATALHPKWDKATTRNDIAACVLDRPSTYAPVQFASDGDAPLRAGAQASIAGFGAVAEGGGGSEALLLANVTVADPARCNRSYSGALRAGQLCAGAPAGGVDSCQGDSGGPLFVARGANGGGSGGGGGDKLYGIVSFGTGCGRADYPGVYTDVRAYAGWLRRQIAAAAAPRGAEAAAAAPEVQASSGNAADADGATDADSACACVNAGARAGCARHDGGAEFFCYVRDPRGCARATPSAAVAGAAWVGCAPPPVDSTAGGAAAAGPAGGEPAPATVTRTAAADGGAR